MGPVSRPSSSNMVVLPVTVSPIATAHWIGAAPRYFGKSDPWRLMQPKCGSASIHGGMILPYATTTIASGAIASNWDRNSGLLRILSGCVTCRPKARAACFTGVGSTICLRPTGLSGCETTSAISCSAACNACKVGTANCGVPQKTSFTALPRAFALHLANLAQRQIPFQGAHAKDKQHPIEMVDLVLKCPREQLFAVHLEPLALFILRSNAYLGRTRNLLANLRKTQAAFFLVLFPFAKDDLGIDEHQLLFRVLAPAQVDHRDTLGHSHLLCSQPDPLRGVHRLKHVRDKLAQFAVEFRHRLPWLLQHRIRVFHDLQNHPRTNSSVSVRCILRSFSSSPAPSRRRTSRAPGSPASSQPWTRQRR